MNTPTSDHFRIAAQALRDAKISDPPVLHQHLLALFVQAGGRFHGPNIETAIMPVELFAPFLESMMSPAGAPGAPEADERARFEAAMSDGRPPGYKFDRHADDHHVEWARGRYIFGDVQNKWEGWQARAQSAPTAQPSADDAPRGWRQALQHAHEVLDTERECRELEGTDRARFTRTMTILSAMLAATPADARDAGAVTIPREVAELVRKVFLPTNPNKMRTAAPETLAAVRAFIAALGAP